MTPEEQKPLCSTKLKPILKKMLKSAGRDADELLHLVQFLVRVAAEFDDFQGRKDPSSTCKEAAFALKYFLEDNDAIPDQDKEFGLKDDLIIARTVIHRHSRALQPFADACGYRWDRLLPAWPAENHL